MINNLNWLIQFRWIAITLQILAIPFALKYTYLSYDNLLYILFIIALLLTFNLLCKFNVVKSKAIVHLIVDLFAFCGLILFCGKIENPFWELIYFHIMMAAFILPQKEDRYFLPLLFGSLIFVYSQSVSPYNSILFTFVPQIIIAIGMWISMRSLALIFFKQEKRINSLETKKSLLDKHRHISLLVSGIVHELGTPLNTVRLKIDRLSGGVKLNSRDIDILQQSVSKLERTAHQLNKTQLGLNQSHKELLNVSELILLAISVLEKDFEINIKSEIQKDVYLLTNALTIQLFLSVCVQNCIDENLHSINIMLSRIGDVINLEVSDNGAGFSDYILDHFKAPYSTTKGQGRGLGLYNSNLAIETLGGNLVIMNNNGAVLKITFKDSSDV